MIAGNNKKANKRDERTSDDDAGYIIPTFCNLA